MSEPVRRALPPSVFARLADATRYLITGVSPDTWFGPLQPLAPMAPPEVKGRQWDYPFGANLNSSRAPKRRFVPRTARARGRAAAPARGDRDPQGPDRGAKLRGQGARPRGFSGKLSGHRSGHALPGPPRPAPFVRRLAQDAARGDAGHRRRDHLSALQSRRLALCARHHRRGDDQAADRRGRTRARAARSRLSADPQGHPRRRFLRRRAPLSAAQCARAQALWHKPGRTDRAHRQYCAQARRLDARLLPRRLLPGRLRHFAQGMDGRPDPLVPGLFRRPDERRSRAPAPDQVHAGRLQADRSATAPAQGPV